MSRRYRSFAKINWHLQVVGRRRDGYHELRTIFQTVALSDDLTIAERAEPGVELAVAGLPLAADASNLAHRAAAQFLEQWAPSAGVLLHLDKRVPIGGGLGGGSSNAATVLLALRERFGVPERVSDLWPIARSLGADVPFFLVGGTALGVGRGDEVVVLPDLPAQDLWIIMPPVSIATATVFRELREIEPLPLAPQWLALAAGTGGDSVPEGHNDLELAVFARYPAVAEAHASLLRCGAPWARLSGSGACLFAPAWQGAAEPDLVRQLPVGSRVWCVRTLGRAEVSAQYSR